ncbi:peptidase [Longispora fulva]|uniref:Aminopeptidase N n=1 Tax=Longispora fulva TaxID=619741 RepID=A0A8J7GMV9_9ACTN|nr:M1 family metallopeptidase [Longispora fulva]MBG6140740.1 aminopeptidase N [Longispora fulva]GIG60996.1 peptidase [Longispora fulva]
MRRPSIAVAVCSALLATGCTAVTATPQRVVPTAAVPDSAGLSTPVADPIYPRRGNAGIDVLRYRLDLTWDTRTFSGTATLTVRATRALDSLVLDLSSTYALDAVTLDGAPVTGALADDKLTVPHPLAADGRATLVVRYRGTPTSTPMPSHRTDAVGLGLNIGTDGSLWTMQEPYGAFTWYPANDIPSDKALYDIAVTVPAGWAGIASGTPGPVQGSTYRYTTSDPVASYLTTLAVGRYQKTTGTGPGGLPLTYWTRAGDAERLPFLQRSPALITWLEQRLGPYPFPTAGVVLVESPSGMETQQMVTLGGRVQPAKLEGVLLHEYAHHWFGDTVTPATWKDVWLNEGWATYLQRVWEAERDHTDLAGWERAARAADGGLRTAAGPPGDPKPGSFAEGNVYTCAALMLHEIRKLVGDAEFWALARDWPGQHRGSTQDRASFTAFVNQHTGRDLTALIDRWLDSPTTP